MPAECWPGNCPDHHQLVVHVRHHDELHVRHHADNDRHEYYVGINLQHHAIEHIDYRWLNHEQWNDK